MNSINIQELGFSEQENKIYLAMIHTGKASASQISSEAGVSYGTIYTILSAMERKGLIKTIPEKTKRFVATSPAELIKIAEKKEEELKKLKKEAMELNKIYNLEESQPVVIAQGKANFHKLKSEMTPHNKRDYSIRPIFDPNPVTLRKMKERKAKNMDYRIIYGPHANKDSIRKYEKYGIPMEQTPVDNVIMAIHDNETLITLLTKNTTILIKDKAFADMLAWLIQKMQWEKPKTI